MDGILIIDKPAGITSHDVVARVRRILKTKRVGHTGTLDPFATGVMVVLVGRATRLAQFLDKDEKEYEATLRFGFETDTGDRTGSPKSQVSGPKPPKVEDVETVLDDFRGEIEQMPPMYSAKKIDGKKLYESARQGIEVERKSVMVTIYQLDIVANSTNEDLGLGTCDLGLKVVCSAGTYIRTIAEDIGRKVGVGAHLAELRRTRAGRFDLSRSVTLDELAKFDNPATALIRLEEAVEHLASITLTVERAGKTRSGLSTRIAETQFTVGQAIRMLDETKNLIAIGFYEEAEKSIRPKVVLV